ncbi:MAG: TolC family protein [Myxococcales bacterium]|nr:TolC family protein [Polyangiaceae bacterium]MDW8247841.1 TolC family protein [Myxococcales bacterium]
MLAETGAAGGASGGQGGHRTEGSSALHPGRYGSVPRATAGGGRSPRTRTGGGDSASLWLWLPLEPWGQRGKRIAEADARVGWADANVEMVQAQAAAEAVRAYGAALVEGERKRLLEQILEASRQESALYRARVEAGDATEQDAAQVLDLSESDDVQPWYPLSLRRQLRS